jgi:hypothetical protein
MSHGLIRWHKNSTLTINEHNVICDVVYKMLEERAKLSFDEQEALPLVGSIEWWTEWVKSSPVFRNSLKSAADVYEKANRLARCMRKKPIFARKVVSMSVSARVAAAAAVRGANIKAMFDRVNQLEAAAAAAEDADLAAELAEAYGKSPGCVNSLFLALFLRETFFCERKN